MKKDCRGEPGALEERAYGGGRVMSPRPWNQIPRRARNVVIGELICEARSWLNHLADPAGWASEHDRQICEERAEAFREAIRLLRSTAQRRGGEGD